MSVLRILTHIIPSEAATMFPDSIMTSEIDTPHSMECSNNTNNASGITLVSETTLSKENIVSPNVELNMALALKYQEVPVLVCSKDSSSQSLNKDINDIITIVPDQGPAIKVASATSNDPSCNEMAIPSFSAEEFTSNTEQKDFNIPLGELNRNGNAINVAQPALHDNTCINHSVLQTYQSYPCAVQPQLNFSQRYPIGFNRHPSIIQRHPNITKLLPTIFQPQSSEIKEDKRTVVDVIAPLEKYFRGNTCLLCGFVSSAKQLCSARMHLVTHLNTKEFKCEVCDKLFATPDYLLYHKKTHVQDLPFPCDICSKTFATKRKLTIHKKRHETSEGLECSFCKIKLTTQSALKKHMTIHTGELPYQCSECSKRFRLLKSLQLHQLWHTGEKKFTCKICNKGFNNKSLCEQHSNAHQGGKGSFKCDHCEKTFNYKSNLLQHQRTHSNVRKHTCGICGMKFKFPHHLKGHIATHVSSESTEK